jgi:hypothetical protein
MATGRRTKRKLKNRPKYKQHRTLKARRKKAGLNASQRRSRARAKAKRQKRTGRKKIGT